jgi:AcrR family transcriptional regulator
MIRWLMAETPMTSPVRQGPPRQPPTAERGSLRDEARDRTRQRIVEGAMAAMVVEGLDVTVDDVAAAACVSRRTIFRHYSSHGELLAAAVSEMMTVLALRVPGPPAPGADVRAWLTETSITIHQLLRDVVGRAFWDIHVIRSGRPPEVTLALDGLAEYRGGIMRDLATRTWVALDFQGEPPAWVVTTFELQLSGFSTNFYMRSTCEDAGRQSARVLWAVLADAGGDRGTPS